MSTGQNTVFAPHFCESVRFYSLFSLLLCNLSIFAGSDENFFPPPLDSAAYTCYPAVLTHLIQQEAPMFHLIFLIPVLVVLLLGILLLAVLCSR